jgi:hypothetical protein
MGWAKASSVGIYLGHTLGRILTNPENADALKALKSNIPDQTYGELSRSDRATLGANAHSGPELALLKWASIHYLAQTPTAKPNVFLGFSELTEPLPSLTFTAIINNSLPSTKIRVADGARDTRDNIAKFMRRLNLSFFPSAAGETAADLRRLIWQKSAI